MVVLGAVASSGSPPSEGGRGGRDLGPTRRYCGLWDHELKSRISLKRKCDRITCSRP